MRFSSFIRYVAVMGLAIIAPDRAAADNTNLLESRRWIQTGEGNSLVPTVGIFSFRPRREVATTNATEVNIHAHHRGLRVRNARRVVYTGRMRVTDENGGVGVTFLSQYPRSDTYYRLRRYGGNNFHIAPHGTEISTGEVDSGFSPVPGSWYSFKILVNAQAQQTRIRAKVWPSVSREPRAWSIDCSDLSATRLRSGRFGIWSMADGEKRWSNLRVEH